MYGSGDQARGEQSQRRKGGEAPLAGNSNGPFNFTTTRGFFKKKAGVWTGFGRTNEKGPLHLENNRKNGC